MKKLVPYDAFRFKAYDADSEYLYGYMDAYQYSRHALNGSGRVNNVNLHDVWNAQTGESLTNLQVNIKGVVKKLGSYIYIVIYATTGANTNKYMLIRCNPDGTNIRFVMKLGEYSGTWYSDVYLVTVESINRGLVNGVDSIVLAEYNVNAGVDPLRIIQCPVSTISESNVGTWTTIITFNLAAKFVKHFHAIQYNELNGRWYICCGDSNTETGIIEWDSSYAWPAGGTLTWANIIAAPGFRVLNDVNVANPQHARTLALIFRPDYIYWGTDSSSTSAQGFCRAAVSTFNAVERLNVDGFFPAGFYTWLAKEYNGQLFVISYFDSTEPADANGYFSIWSSTTGESGTWREINRILIRSDALSSTLLPTYLGVINGYFVISVPRSAKGGNDRTVLCKLGEKYQDATGQDTLLPAVFVGKNGITGQAGSDSLARTAGTGSTSTGEWWGFSSRYPYATLEYAMQNCAEGAYISLLTDDLVIAAAFTANFSSGVAGFANSPGTDASALVTDRKVRIGKHPKNQNKIGADMYMSIAPGVSIKLNNP